jgi:hypothetical protein
MKRHSRRHFLRGAGGAAAVALGAPLLNRVPVAVAAGGGIACPNPIPAVNENRCSDPASWSSAFQLTANDGAIVAFTSQASYDLSEIASSPVTLNLGRFAVGATAAQIRIFRLGYYGGRGGRLVYTKNVSLPDPGTQPDIDPVTGKRVIVGTTAFALTDFAPQTSGVYIARIVTSTNTDRQTPFVIRDDTRPRELLVAMPTNTWQAYNNNAKSLYDNAPDFSSASPVTIAGTRPDSGLSRAVKVSFQRDHDNQLSKFDWVLHTEFPLIYWLERMGYDVAYTEDVAVHRNPAQLLPDTSRVFVIAGHSEYWTQQMFDGVKNAKAAGTHIAAMGANTAYWRIRYEDGERTIACYKTIQGTGPQAGGGAAGVNDPVSPTTTFRDRGAIAGAAEAPAGGRPGIAQPENQLFGVFYVGDDGGVTHPIQVPAGAGAGGEFGAHRAWRNTAVAAATGATIGTNLVGWEWDQVPGGGPLHDLARSVQPAGVQKLWETDPTAGESSGGGYISDDGRAKAAGPAAGNSKLVGGAIHTAPSGAIVFATGSMQFSWGLGPHYGGGPADDYVGPRKDDSDPRIQQLTYNVLADMGALPSTPSEEIVLDPVPVTPTGPTGPTGTTGPAPTGPAGADTTAPRLYVSRGGVRVGPTGILRVRVFLAADELQGASGVLTLRTTGLVRTSKRAKARRLTLGAKSFQVLAGHTAIVEFRLSTSIRRLITERKRLSVTAETVAHDRANNKTTLRTPFLALPYKKPVTKKK